MPDFPRVIQDTDYFSAAVEKLNDNFGDAAPKASPALTGIPTAPTAAAGTNTTQIATTAFVAAGLADKLNSSEYTAADVLAKVKTLDGSGSGLDADTLDGQHAAAFAAASHGNHVPTVQTANNAKFLRNDNSWQTISPGNIGAAVASHAHGGITTDGAVGSAAGKALLTGAGGAVQAGTLPIGAGGTGLTTLPSGQVLMGNGADAPTGKAIDATPTISSDNLVKSGGVYNMLTQKSDTGHTHADKAPLASPALTGTPTAPTAATGTNTTQIANTAFVAAGLADKLNSSGYTAADVLAKVKTLDGSGSGLDADTLDGQHANYFAPYELVRPTLNVGVYNHGTPTAFEAALIDENFSNKLWFYDLDYVEVESSSDGVNYVADTSVTDTELKKLFAGNYSANVQIPKGSWFRFTFTPIGMVHLKWLYFFASANGSTYYVTIETREHGSEDYTTLVDRTQLSGWPAHGTIYHQNITFSQSSGKDRLRVTINPELAGNAYDIFYPNMQLRSMKWLGNYPVQNNTIYNWDENKNVTFPASVSATAFSGNSSSATKLNTPRTINGVAFDGTNSITVTADPNTHTHAVTGDEITGTLPVSKGGTGATDVSVARDNMGVGAKPTVITVTLPADGWTSVAGGYTITLDASGVQTGDYAYIPCPDPAQHAAYVATGAVMQTPTTANRVTFAATVVPTGAITVNILKMEVA